MTLQTYICHKTVKAAKITSIFETARLATLSLTPANTASRWVDFPSTVVVLKDYITKHSPEIGGYYVQYKGYESFSPAEVFEADYTLEEVHNENK